MLRWRATVAIALAAAGLATCRGPAKPGEVVDRTVERHLVLRVTGDRSVEFEGRTDLHAVTRNGAREQIEFNVAAIEMVEPIALDDGESVQFDMGLAGVYTGDGEYTLPAGLGVVRPTSGPTAPPPPQDSRTISNVSVLFTSATTGERFGYLLEPCAITLDDDATVGSIRCPALVNETGEKVALDVTWSP
jgi:hypothetical protein